MPTLLETLETQLAGSNLKQLASQLGADEKSTGAAISAALPALLSALARNSARPEGATALHQALQKDHDGSILENIGGFLRAPGPANGDGILKHVLGTQRTVVEKGLAKSSGLSAASMAQLMATLAPLVLGALGKQQRQSGLNAAKLGGYLGEQRQSIERQLPQAMQVIGSLLDADGDGDGDVSDLVKKGSGFLSKILGK
jgi:hypothetical protein